MSDRGIDLQLPQYEDQALVAPGDAVMWEVEYDDSTYLRQDMGAQYKDIDRNRLRAFRLTLGGDLLVHAPLPDGATGQNLLFRRRVEFGMGGHAGPQRRVVHMIAWVPMGPVLVLDIADPQAQVRTHDTFIIGDPDFQPPVPVPMEGEHFTIGPDMVSAL